MRWVTRGNVVSLDGQGGPLTMQGFDTAASAALDQPDGRLVVDLSAADPLDNETFLALFRGLRAVIAAGAQITVRRQDLRTAWLLDVVALPGLELGPSRAEKARFPVRR